MMSDIPVSTPAWHIRERWNDLAWLSPKLAALHLAAGHSYQQLGRGALVIDTSFQGQGEATPAAYFTQDTLLRYADAHCAELVASYRPQDEIVTILLKQGCRSNAYRLRPH